MWITLALFFPSLIISLFLMSDKFTEHIADGQLSYGKRNMFALNEIVS